MSTVDLKCEKCGKSENQLLYSPVRRTRLCMHCALSEIDRGGWTAESWELFLGYLAGVMSGGLAVYMGLML